MQHNTSAASRYGITPAMTRMIVAILVALMAFMAVDFQNPDLLRTEKRLTDFDAFYAAGKMFWSGQIDAAYHYPAFAAVQHQTFGVSNSFMPWAYPPPFNLIVALLALLPIGVAYALFVATTLALYLFVLKRLARAHLPVVLLAIFPVLILNTRSGQNGFLTGALLGLSLLLAARARTPAGLALGAMIIKPHLALGAGALALAGGRWKILALAAATAALAAALATGVCGAQIWASFLAGMREAAVFLQGGGYPLFRMASLYATLHTLGVPPPLALAAQLLAATAAIATIGVLARRPPAPARMIGITAFASLYTSPYLYDYDLTLLGVAVAALAPELLRKATRSEALLLLFLCWLAGGCGLLQSALATPDGSEPPYALASLALTLLAAFALRIDRRAPPRADAQHAAGRAA